MHDLRDILIKYLEHSKDNPAIRQILAAYSLYHWVVILMCGTLALIFMGLTIYFFITRSQSEHAVVPKTILGIWSAFNVLLTAGYALIDATAAFDQTQGVRVFAHQASLRENVALERWIISGRSVIPQDVQKMIDWRINYHSLRFGMAVIGLLVALGAAIYLWRRLIKRNNRFVLLLGLALLLAIDYLMVMAFVNLQGIIAPLAAVIDGLRK